jgi:5-hydroxyisourate hydrolase
VSVSTHVLDAVRGRPAQGVAVSLASSGGSLVSTAVTDADGRVAALAGDLPVGVYRLSFAVEEYLGETFYPEVVIAFRVRDGAEHHHVPLLLSPYAYSTYRGS